MSETNRLKMIVGENNVLDSPDVLDAYSKDLSFVPHVRPRCVAKPGKAEEVQEIVKWANKTMTPLVPVSSGSPHFRGDTVPSMGGAVIVDLSRMKKIVRIDSRNRVAMVEPGVTFGELQHELEKAGLSAYMPLCPRNTKSVLGSMLEREPITMPTHHWDSIDPFLCGEIIFGTGDKLRSGEAAGPDAIEDQWKIGKAQMVPFGLGQFDESRLILGAQGTIGIIIWATMKCRPLSALSRSFLIPSDALEPLIDLSYSLLRIRLGDYCFILNDLNLACLIFRDPEEIKRLREALPRWIMVLGIEGHGELPEEKVSYQEADLKDMILRAGLLVPTSTLSDISAEDVSSLLSQPSAEPYWKLRYKGGCHDIFFLTTLDRTAGFVDKMDVLSQSRRIAPSDIGIYIQPTVQGTSCHLEFDVYYGPDEVDKTKRLADEGSEELAKIGAFFSRPYGRWANIAYSRAMETTIVQRKVKKIFDPNNILNPGKLCF